MEKPLGSQMMLKDPSASGVRGRRPERRDANGGQQYRERRPKRSFHYRAQQLKRANTGRFMRSPPNMLAKNVSLTEVRVRKKTVPPTHSA